MDQKGEASYYLYDFYKLHNHLEAHKISINTK